MSIFKPLGDLFHIGGRHRGAKASGSKGTVKNVNSDSNLINNQRDKVEAGLAQLRNNTPGANDQSVTWTPAHYTPQMEGAQQTSSVRANPQMAAAQMAALRQLQAASNYGGTMGAQEAAAMNQATAQAGQQNAAAQYQAQQQALAQGRRGGGQEVATAAAGSGVGGLYGAGTGNMVAARQRALQALGQNAELGGNIRQQGMGEQFQRADDADAARVRDLNRGVEARETNANVDTQASMYNSQNPFRVAQHDLTRAGIEAGNIDYVRNLGVASDAAQRQTYKDLFSGLTQAGSAGAQYAYDQNQNDEDDERKSWMKR